MLSGASLTSPSYATLAELATATLVSLAIIALAPILGAWALFWVGGAMAALKTILRCRELGREARLEEFYNLYAERVRRLIDAPPEPGWDGVWVAERK